MNYECRLMRQNRVELYGEIMDLTVSYSNAEKRTLISKYCDS